MSETESAAFPKKEYGTTDWEFVFESPDTGLIGLVESARSAKTLKASSHAIIIRLFMRPDDAERKKEFNHWLDYIIPNDNIVFSGADARFLNLKKEITKLLRQIKTVRVKKAEEYIARRKQEEKG